ncbi:MAG: type II toxin-antitoxin system RelE/ParE family toxin [Zoogloeaceae bacterium]|jgi:putative addiction module killer protein|nr:type II toxin-antitoxin system RelE/ParE family toxin [Zoogloeaceae bacterium]
MNTIETTETFDAWLEALDQRAVGQVNARIRRAELGNFGDAKPVGEGVSEMRIHYGPGYRVYFKQTGRTIYLLLAGGNKSTQSADIKAALDMARQLKNGED